jgi:hypothetical protein
MPKQLKEVRPNIKPKHSCSACNFKKIVQGYEFQFIILAALRYTMGRRSYSPSLVVDWIKENWKLMDVTNKDRIQKEVVEAIERADIYIEKQRQEKSKFFMDLLGDPQDRETWECFRNWIIAKKPKEDCASCVVVEDLLER